MEGVSDQIYDSSVIAELFIQKYYAQMSEEPKMLYPFYTNSGTMAHLVTPEAICKNDSVTGMQNIEEKCSSIANDYYRSIVNIKSVDSQFVTSSDITILVNGVISFYGSSGAVKPFIQSFYLEKNKNQSRSYSIRNSIFRLLSTPAPTPSPLTSLLVDTLVNKAPVVTDDNSIVPVPVVTSKGSQTGQSGKTGAIGPKEKSKNTETNAPTATAPTSATIVQPIDEVINKVAAIDIKSSTKSSQSPEVAVNETAAAVSALAQAQAVFSYADMVLADNQQPALKEKVKNKGKSGNTSTPGATAAIVQSNASATPVTMVEGAHIYNGRQKFSVYVHPVDGLAIDEVKTAFTRFGTVQHVSNFVIAKGTGGYAFVEFTCAEHMRAALDNKEPILIGEKILKVEKKQVKDKSAQGYSLLIHLRPPKKLLYLLIQGIAGVSNDGAKEKGKVVISDGNIDGTRVPVDASSGSNGKSKQHKNKDQNETGVVKSPDTVSSGDKDQPKKGKGGGSNGSVISKQTGGDKPKPNNEKQVEKKQVTADSGVVKKTKPSTNNDNASKKA